MASQHASIITLFRTLTNPRIGNEGKGIMANEEEAIRQLGIAIAALVGARFAVDNESVQPGVYVLALIREVALVTVMQKHSHASDEDAVAKISQLLLGEIQTIRYENDTLSDLQPAPGTPRMRVTVIKRESVPQDSITDQINAAIEKGAKR